MTSTTAAAPSFREETRCYTMTDRDAWALCTGDHRRALAPGWYEVVVTYSYNTYAHGNDDEVWISSSRHLGAVRPDVFDRRFPEWRCARGDAAPPQSAPDSIHAGL